MNSHEYKLTMDNRQTSKQKEFSEAYMPLHDRLVRFVQSQIWSNEDVKDIVNETVLQTYERFNTIKNRQALLSYMFTIASRQVYKFIRRKHVIPDHRYTFNENIVDSDATPDTKLEAKELFESLLKLPDAQREALVLFQISGLSINEIQQIQGVSVSAVKSRLARGREALRKFFDEAVLIDNSTHKSSTI